MKKKKKKTQWAFLTNQILHALNVRANKISEMFNDPQSSQSHVVCQCGRDLCSECYLETGVGNIRA